MVLEDVSISGNIGNIIRTSLALDLGGMILLFLIQFADTGLKALINNGIIPETLLSATDVASLRFVLIGVGLMALLVFRPQGIFGDRREVMLDAR